MCGVDGENRQISTRPGEIFFQRDGLAACKKHLSLPVQPLGTVREMALSGNSVPSSFPRKT